MIKKIFAKAVCDSRGEKTIKIIVKTKKGKFITSAPAGKSTGKYEVKSYAPTLSHDIQIINLLDIKKINKIINEKINNNSIKQKNKTSLLKSARVIDIVKSFSILRNIEKLLNNRIGGNSLFALGASLLKAFAKESRLELWEFLSGERKIKSINIRPVGNTIGGGLHSKGINGICPDFQEFLFISNGENFAERVRVNDMAYKIAGKLLKGRKRNDEGGWETNKTNEGVLSIMKEVQDILKKKGLRVDIGLDIAASSFFKNKKYTYKNKKQKLNKKEQINYISELINRYGLFYIEDGLDENDFSGSNKLLNKIKKIGNSCLIVGDDLTTTNPIRLNRAIKMKSINAIIVKPNQIGSLLKVKKVIEICKNKRIKTIISHRSGETLDNTIVDLGVGFGVDFIKTGICGKVRRSKLNRLIRIEKKIN